MMDIKEEFMRKYSKTLRSFIKGDTSGRFLNDNWNTVRLILFYFYIGNYKQALFALCGEIE